MLLASNGVWAQSFQSGGIYYNITSNTAPYTVEVSSGPSGAVVIPSSVTYNGRTYSVTSIGSGAYFGYALTSITIPSSIKSIYGSFYGYDSLQRTNYTGTIAQWCEINFDYYYANPVYTSHNLYINNSLVTNLVIPNTVDTIKACAFYGDTAITSVTIPNSVTSIGWGAFGECNNLQRTNYTGTIAQWCGINFGEYANPVHTSHNLYINNSLVTNLVIPNTVDTIKAYAFVGDTAITSVVIGNSVRHIDYYAFEGCYWINCAIIPYTVSSIKDGAFSGTRTIVYNGNASGSNWGADSIMRRSVYINGDYVYLDTTRTNILFYIGNGGNVTIPNTVTKISKEAFCRCKRLSTVTIPNNVDSIGNNAFWYCIGLTTVYFNADSCTFMSKRELTYEGVMQYTTLYPVFKMCPNFRTLNIGNNVRNIPDNAFCFCSALRNINIPNSVTMIGDCAFIRCDSLASITIGNSVTSIGDSAFYGCGALSSVTIPNSVTSIGEYAFCGCTGLGSVTIGNSVTSIRQGSFYGCTSLGSVTIGNSVTSIGKDAFYGCNSLQRTNYTGTIAQWCRINFFYYYLHDYANPVRYSHNLYINNLLVTNLVIPNTVDTIKPYTFYGDTAITNVVIGDSVKSIGSCAFFDCTGLSSITIPNSVTSIGWEAFYGCNSLQRTNYTGTIAQWCGIDFDNNGIANPVYYSQNLYINNSLVTDLVIPNAVDAIKPNSFYGDTAITSITFRRSNTVIGNNAFYGVSTNIPVYVPCGASSWYIAKLSNFLNFYETLPFSFTAVVQDTTMGSVTTVTAPNCNNGAMWTIRATANTNYVFSRWSDRDTNAQRTITVNRDTALTAYFTSSSQQWYNFVVISEDTNKGRVQIVTQPTPANPQATIVALPNTGYTFTRWSDGNTQNPRTLTVTRDTTIIAYFSQSGNQWYNFAVVSEDTAKGRVQVLTQPSQASPQATILALPNTGYSFTRWSDGNTQNPRTLTVTQDTVLIAYFTSSQQQWYNFFVMSEDTAKGTVLVVNQPTQANPRTTIVATPKSGYTFTRWSDGNTQNPRTLTVTQDTVLIAYFTQSSQQWYNFVVVSEDTAKGTVQVITQPSQASPQATILALPKSGYTFTRWSDGNTQNPRTLTVTQDTVLIAYFTSNQGIADAGNDNIIIRTTNGHILLEGIGNERVYVSDVLGRVIYHSSVNEKTDIAVKNRGVYFVKVGNRSAQKVVVM